MTLRGTTCYGHPLTPSRPSLSIFFPAYNDAGTIASLCLVAGTASTVAMLKGRAGPAWLDALGLPNLCVTPEGEVSGTLAA